MGPLPIRLIASVLVRSLTEHDLGRIHVERGSAEEERRTVGEQRQRDRQVAYHRDQVLERAGGRPFVTMVDEQRFCQS